jgi:cytochrome P450
MSATGQRPRSAAAVPAGPAGHPLLGMAGALRGDLLGTLQDGFARYGDVVAYRIGPRRLQRRIVAFHHPDDVRRIFASGEEFTRRTPAYGVLRELLGENLVTADGADWQRQKRLLQPLFTRAATDRLAALIEREARAVAEHVASGRGRTVDALRLAERYALRVLGRVLFKDGGELEEDVDTALARLIPLTEQQLAKRVRRPLRVPLRWPAPGNRRFAETRDALQATMARVLARQPRPGGDELDLVGKLRSARDPEGERPLAEQEVRDQALLFLLAGYSTTSNALCSTLHLLGRHPEIQERVASGGDELARAAVQEGLRLHPPSYVLGRRVRPGGAEIAGHALPGGTDVLVSPWITHRHPGFWSDPEAFDPWRFVGGDDRALHAWVPFGAGARACIGRQLALLESTLLLRALLERCRLESLDAEYPMAQLISLRPSRPVRIACRPR